VIDIKEWTDNAGRTKFYHAVTAIGATPATLLVSEDVTLLGNVTIPPTLILKFTPGSIITTNAFNLTINGRVDEPRMQIFTAAAGKVTFWTGSTHEESYPEWWGGFTNDTISDLAAIQASVASGNITSLAAGEYYINGTIVLTENSTLRGDMSNGMVRPLITQTSNASVISVLGATTKHVCIKNLRIRYSGITPSGHNTINIAPTSFSDFIVVENILIDNAEVGIYAANVGSSWFNRLRIGQFTKSAVSLNTCKDVKISKFIFDGGNQLSALNIYGTEGALRLNNSNEAIVVTDGDIVSSNYALYSTGASSAYGECPGNSYFTNVYFDSANYGNMIMYMNTSVFTSCWFTSTKAYTYPGLHINAGHDLTFTNCTFNETGGNGLTVTSGLTGLVVQGSLFKDVGSNTGVTTARGIEIGAGTSEFTLTNNVVDLRTTSGGMDYGILVNTGGSDKYIIAHNRISDYSVAEIVDGGTGNRKTVESGYAVASYGSMGAQSSYPVLGSTAIVPIGSHNMVFNAVSAQTISTINVGGTSAADGYLLTIRGNNYITITSGGNIHLQGDFTFDAGRNYTMTLMYAAPAGYWMELSRAANDF